MLKLITGQRARGPAPTELPVRGIDDLAPLVQRCQRSERDAIRTLVVTLGPTMLQMVRRVLGSGHPDAEDVYQEAVIGLVKALPGFRAECSTLHFGCRIATLTALKARRRKRPEREVALPDTDGEDAVEDQLAAGVDERDWALIARRRDILRRLLDELPEVQAEALVLHCVAGLTLEEVAAVARTPVETARSRLRVAKTALRERIARDPSLSDLLEDSP